MLTRSKLVLLLISGACAVPGVAAAQDPSVDPDAGSPSGTIYQLPLDGARGDAAPKRVPKKRVPAPAAPADDAGSRPAPSAIRSENGFGSSSEVPGTVTDTDDRDGGATASGSGGSGSSSGGSGGSGSSGSDVASGDRRADARPPAGTAGSASPALTAATDADDDPSALGVYALLICVVAVGIAAGLVTRSRRGA